MIHAIAVRRHSRDKRAQPGCLLWFAETLVLLSGRRGTKSERESSAVAARIAVSRRFQEKLSRHRLSVQLFCVVGDGLGEKYQCVLIGVGERAQDALSKFSAPLSPLRYWLARAAISSKQSGLESACTCVLSVAIRVKTVISVGSRVHRSNRLRNGMRSEAPSLAIKQ
jgi:hypothetical protein